MMLRRCSQGKLVFSRFWRSFHRTTCQVVCASCSPLDASERHLCSGLTTPGGKVRCTTLQKSKKTFSMLLVGFLPDAPSLVSESAGSFTVRIVVWTLCHSRTYIQLTSPMMLLNMRFVYEESNTMLLLLGSQETTSAHISGHRHARNSSADDDQAMYLLTLIPKVIPCTSYMHITVQRPVHALQEQSRKASIAPHVSAHAESAHKIPRHTAAAQAPVFTETSNLIMFFNILTSFDQIRKCFAGCSRIYRLLRTWLLITYVMKAVCDSMREKNEEKSE